jgi:hypothetical protein
MSNPFPMSIRIHMRDYWKAQVVKWEDAIAEELQRDEPSEHRLEVMALQVAQAEERVVAMEKAISA